MMQARLGVRRLHCKTLGMWSVALESGLLNLLVWWADVRGDDRHSLEDLPICFEKIVEVITRNRRTPNWVSVSRASDASWRALLGWDVSWVKLNSSSHEWFWIRFVTMLHHAVEIRVCSSRSDSSEYSGTIQQQGLLDWGEYLNSLDGSPCVKRRNPTPKGALDELIILLLVCCNDKWDKQHVSF